MPLSSRLSPELGVLFRPFTTYRALQESVRPGPLLYFKRPALWLLVVGVFVSLTTSGRLVWWHLVLAPLAWAFAPVLQIFWLWVVLGLCARREPRSRAVDLFFVGQAPWLFFMLSMAGICVLGSDTWHLLEWLSTSGVLLVAFVSTFLWGFFLTFAYFRSALALGTVAGLLWASFWNLGYGGSLVLYFWVTGQLPPLLLALS